MNDESVTVGNRDSSSGGRGHGREVVPACLLRMLVLSAVVPTISSCAWISTHVAAPGLQIEKISNRSARVVSANFWRDGGQLSLRGEVVSNPVSKSVLRGHLDIEIVNPDGTEAACLTTKPRMMARRVRKPYEVAVRTLPDPGSTVRIRHHLGADHMDCVNRDEPYTRAQPVPDVDEAAVDTALAFGCSTDVINPIELRGGAMCMQEK